MRLVLLLFLTLAQLAAHEVSESYLQLEVQEERLRGTWEVALRDLELALGLDGNRDDTLTWNEVRHGRPSPVRRQRFGLRELLHQAQRQLDWIRKALSPAHVPLIDQPGRRVCRPRV